MSISYPRQSARTRRFSLGVPRAFQIAPDESRVTFLRTRAGDDPVTCLWTLDTATGEEECVADPAALDVPGEEDLPAEERARRERAREQAGGIVGYATDQGMRQAVFTLAGRLYAVDLGTALVRELPARTPVFDPRPDPAGRRIAYVSGRTLRVIEMDGTDDRALVQPESDQVSYGLAEFVAAEEMGRMRGHWWSPDGGTLLAARVDETPVQRWHIAAPANPDRPPSEIAYPAAGTPNALVSLVLLKVDGRRTAVAWDRGMFPYFVAASWDRHGLLIVVQPRDQRSQRVLSVDPTNGATSLLHTEHDPVWTEIVPGLPVRTASGDLVWTTEDRDADTRRITVGGKPVTPVGLQVRSVLGVDGESILFTGSEEPTEVHLYSYAGGETTRLTEGAGVFGGIRSGGITVVTGARLDRPGSETEVRTPAGTHPVASFAETPVITPKVELLRAGDREIRTAVLLPTGWEPDQGRLPVLMDPYGGPHAQRVLAVHRALPRRAARGRAAAVRDHDGEALVAVLERPDVFHGGIAGAPVTDWRLYDTHYTERYLGHPDEEPELYAANSLIERAADLKRPLMVIHGLADDNVVAAHTLRFSSALLAAGRPHTVLPLSGVTHMTPQEVVAENLLHIQVDYLKSVLAR